MPKPRIIIADRETAFVTPLQAKFIYEFLDEIELEVITEEQYFHELFQTMQKADILIVEKQLFHDELSKHDINHIFVMTDAPKDESDTENSGQIHTIFKYTNVKGIFLEIIGISGLKMPLQKTEFEPKVVLVTSACGGTGKTTLALGIATALSDMYKRVLYVESARIQTYQYFLSDPSPIDRKDIYGKMVNAGKEIYQEIKPVLRKEKFTYLPPLRAALLSFGIPIDVFGKIAKSAKLSGDYDYIVIDADNTFDDEKSKLMNVADAVIIVTEQSAKTTYATDVFVSNINNKDSEKYLFICNKYSSDKENVLSISGDAKFKIDEYVHEFDDYSDLTIQDFAKDESIRKVAFLLL